MSKGKPRWYQDKPQNNYGRYCKCFDGLEEKSIDEYLVTEFCDVPHSVILKTCRCDPHRCMKALNKCMAGKDPKKKYYKGCSWNQKLIDTEIYGK